MRNIELLGKRLERIKGKIKNLKLLVTRGGNIEEFKKEISSLEETVNEVESMIERETSPLRNG